MGRLNMTVVEREIRIQAADGTMKVFAARPDGGGPFPVAVVYMFERTLDLWGRNLSREPVST